MDTTFTLFGLTAHAYGAFAAVGALLTLLLMGLLGYQSRMPAGTARVFGLLAIPLGIAGARLAYCALNIGLFTETYENPWLMLRFFDGGLSMTGLLLGLLLAAYLTSRVMKVSCGKVADVMCVPLGLLIALLREAERFTDLGAGKVAEGGALVKAAPWLFLSRRAGVNVEYRLAVYHYEAAAGILLFAVMLALFASASRRKNARSGDLALLFFALYGASQTLLESMRDDGHMLMTFLRAAQAASALMPLAVAGVFTRRYLHIQKKANARIVLTWAALLLCVAGVAILEFSLDGRLTWGAPSLARDYGLMAALCAVLLAMPCSLYATLTRSLYREEHIAVHVPRG